MSLPKVHLRAAYPSDDPYLRVAVDYRPVAAQDDTPAAAMPTVGQVTPNGVVPVGRDVATGVASNALTEAAAAMLGDVSDVVNSADVSYVAGAALVYHGYKRTGSILWALLYGLAGKEIPIVAVPVALAQGYGRRKPCP